MDRQEQLEEKMPDLAARQPAEGNVDFPEEEHLRSPQAEPSSELPVEGAALAEEFVRRR